jgi:tRNA pseudouridine55 synthase
LLLDKPKGPTSHDVVSALRAATGERRIGHSGTLDPMATGLLLVLIGSATRLEQYLVGQDKAYEATIVFGKQTDTDDAEGTTVATAAVSPEVSDPKFAAEVLAGFLGVQEQVPPAYSALKRDGVPAYRIARAGGTPKIDARMVEVLSATLQRVDESAPAWDVTFDVSKGTYIRALARDIGRAAGTCAHLSALRRTRIGGARIEGAVALKDAVSAAEAGEIRSRFVDPVELLALPSHAVAPGPVRDGRALAAPDAPVGEGARVALVDADSLLAIYRRDGAQLLPEVVFTPVVVR